MSDTDFSDEVFAGEPEGPPVFSLAEAQKKSEEFSKELFKYKSGIQAILERHESKIRERWTKKSPEKQRGIIRESWANMPKSSRPDVQMWLGQEKSTTDAFMWPHINSKDLMKPNIFLIFLNARGRHEPHEFVDADLDTVLFGWNAEVIIPATVSGYSMQLHGRTDPKSYGELVPSEDGDDPESPRISRTGIHPGCGLKILEIQSRTLEFLYKCCRNVLQDVKDILSAEIQPEPEKIITGNSEFASLQSAVSEGPYRVPAEVNFPRLLTLARAEANSLQENIWNIREDPSIFAEILEQTSEHEVNYVAGDWGGETQIVHLEATGDKSKFWNTVVKHTVKCAYLGFATFHELASRIQALEDMSQKYESIQWPDADVPPDYVAAYQAVRYLLSRLESDLSLQLARGIAVSPLLREKIRVTVEEGQQIVHVDNQGKDYAHAVQPFVYLIRLLFNKEEFRVRTLHVIVTEIEQLIEKDSKIKELIPTWVASRLSTLLMIAEFQRQLYHFQPWTWQAEQEMVSEMDGFEQEYNAAFVKGWRLEKDSIKLLHSFANPVDGKFFYPAHERRTESNVEALRKAEEKLDKFWNFVDKGDKTFHSLVRSRLSSERTIRRTPPWTVRATADKSAKTTEYLHVPGFSASHQPENQVTGAYDRNQVLNPRKKEKWAREGDPEADLEADLEADPEIDGEVGGNHEGAPEPAEIPPPHVISVDRRAHHVIEALFHSPLSGRLPGEIPWRDFLYAVRHIGFSGEKLGGSAWCFTPDQEHTGVEQSINFHEPHPGSKILVVWVRSNGRRMTDLYGWTAETFRLE